MCREAEDRATQRPNELPDLLYWLANEDLYTSRYVREWLDRTPPEVAADILGHIAANAQPEPHSFWYMLFRGILMVMSTSETVSEKGPAGRKAGIRAALLLARLNDPRSLPPLVRVFETERFWEGKYQEMIEEALLGVLSGAMNSEDLRPYADVLQSLAERLQKSSRGRRKLPARQADLLAVTLRRLEEMKG